MYVLLEGQLTCTTHWVKKEGFSHSQQNYLKYVMMQQGKRIEDYARESKLKPSAEDPDQPLEEPKTSEMTKSLISAIHKKNFEGYFKSNAYLKQLKTTDKKHLKIDVKASHCAPVL